VAALGYELPAPPAEPPPLEFKTFKTKTRNEKRGTIKWKTSDPASTSVTGTNGYSVQSAELVKQHKVVVRAKKNQTVDFTVVSIRDDGSEVNRTVTWPFE
jgi:hypothetical protein